MSYKDEKPYLSIVVTARNDDHGEGFLERMQIFVSGILEQLTKYDLSSELIIVEWNPPSDRPRLSEAISWTHKDGPCKIRIIEVSPDIHNKFQHSDKIQLFEYKGKNVGIRRARGKFVLSANPDLLFSDDLIKYFASKSLKSEFFYRIDRYNVKIVIPYSASVDKQLDYCKHSVTNISTKYGDFTPDTIPNKKDTKELYPQLHTNASGDFMLMAKEKWHALHGNSEQEMHPVYVDSIMLHMAYQYGLREKILEDPMRLYHIEHPGGWNPENPDEVYQRLKDKSIPYIDYEKYQSIALQMHKEARPIIFNDENWGLGTEILPEISKTPNRLWQIWWKFWLHFRGKSK